MKSLFFTCFLTISLLPAGAQQNNPVTIGSVDSIYSQILKEQRNFWVHLPASARDGLHPKKKFPVVYLLDGDKNFTWVVGMIDLLSSVNGNSFFPEMIVVGILNTARTRDLTLHPRNRRPVDRQYNYRKDIRRRMAKCLPDLSKRN